MLSDEEKKAIEILKDNIKSLEGPTPFKHTNYEKVQAIETILNLIDKQSKEIEELKKNKGYHLGFIDGGIAKRYEMEDKIKAKTIEIQNRPVKDEFITASQGKLNTIIDMESLLEKE